jgi:hypothetical protein
MVKHVHPRLYVYYIKEALVNCEPHLFEDFESKDKILKLSTSQNTVKEDILKTNDNNLCLFYGAFLIGLDKSTDSTSARLAIIARYS